MNARVAMCILIGVITRPELSVKLTITLKIPVEIEKNHLL